MGRHTIPGIEGQHLHIRHIFEGFDSGKPRITIGRPDNDCLAGESQEVSNKPRLELGCEILGRLSRPVMQLQNPFIWANLLKRSYRSVVRGSLMVTR